MKGKKLCINDLQEVVKKLHKFHKRFSQHFRRKTRNVIEQTRQYLHGQLIEKKRGNMTNLSKVVPDSNNQRFQHVISNSPWEDEGVISDIQRDVNKQIGDKEEGSLHIDESSFVKKGNSSVGVKRQYCGRLGKVENCQVGVFLGYNKGSYRTLIDKRLYLPLEWIEDKKRRERCGVPEDIEFKTKAELGLEMVREAKGRGVEFGWIGMDCHYGEQPWLLDELDKDRTIYIADIPCNRRVWLEKPKTGIPERKGNRGPHPEKKQVLEGESSPMEVQKIAEIRDLEWHRVFLRDTERKELWSQMGYLRVYPVNDELPGKEVWLIIRKDEGESKVKYQLCNVPEDTNIEKLGKMSCSRYWMERAIEDGKGLVGLGDYEVRGWRGWHHHMTMSLLAMLFLLELQIEWKDKAPQLTVQDVREILEIMLPKREITPDGILKIIQQKHKDRDSARKYHHRSSMKSVSRAP